MLDICPPTTRPAGHHHVPGNEYLLLLKPVERTDDVRNYSAMAARGLLAVVMILLGGCVAKDKREGLEAEPDKPPASTLADSGAMKREEPPPPKEVATAEPFLEAVFTATLGGKGDSVSQALKNGFDVNQQDAEGRTLLMMAAFNGHAGIARMQALFSPDVGGGRRAGEKRGIPARQGSRLSVEGYRWG